MAPQRKDDLREKIKARYRELKSLGKTLVSASLEAEFKLSKASIAYYLKEPGVDRRRILTPHVLKKLSPDDADGITLTAERHGLEVTQVKKALARFGGVKAKKTPKQMVKAQGYFSWTSRTEARAAGVTTGDLTTAREELRKGFGLSLDNPNLLKHKKSGKFIRLGLSDQVSLILDPHGFICRRAKWIAKNWESTTDAVSASLRGDK